MTEYVGGIEIDSSGPTATGLYNAIKSAYNFIYINRCTYFVGSFINYLHNN